MPQKARLTLSFRTYCFTSDFGGVFSALYPGSLRALVLGVREAAQVGRGGL